MKKMPLIWIVIAVTLLVLFPSLAGAVATATAAVAVWLGGQPLLVAFLLGLAARPYLKTKHAKH